MMTTRNIWLLFTALLFTSGCQLTVDPPGNILASPPKPQKPTAIPLDRSYFPCNDPLNGLWRVHKYLYAWDGKFTYPEKEGYTMKWAFKNDSGWIYRADTLLARPAYYRLAKLHPANRFANRFTYGLVPVPPKPGDSAGVMLASYYVRFSGDSLFMYQSYADWYDFWLVRDCK